MRRCAPLSQSIRLSRTSIRPEKAQSNRRWRSASNVRASEIQSREKGLYFFKRLKCLAQGTRTGINSSTSPCPPRKEARSELTRREIRAEGKLRRRFLRKGTRIARSPKFQYSTTRMLEGGSAGFFRGGRGGIRGFRNRATDSKIRTSRHLPGVMGNNLARAEGSLKLGRFVPRTSRHADVDFRLRFSSAGLKLCFTRCPPVRLSAHINNGGPRNYSGSTASLPIPTG